MYIIVIGGGRVGYYLTKALLNEGHEVTIVEKKAGYCEIINDEMGGICVHGDGCETTTLDEIGTCRADILIAVTGDDEDNLVACQMAKQKFNVSRTIARIRNPQNETIFKKLGIDVTVSSTNVILEHIEEEVLTHPLTHPLTDLLAMKDKGMDIIEVEIPPGSAIIGKPLKDITFPEGSRPALVLPKGRRPRMASADTVLNEGDRLIAITPRESESELRAILGGD